MRFDQEELRKAMHPTHPAEDQNPMSNDDEVLVFTAKGYEDEWVNIQGENDPEGFPLLYDREIAKKDKDNIEYVALTFADDLDDGCAKIVRSTEALQYYIKCNTYNWCYDLTGVRKEVIPNRMMRPEKRDVYGYREVSKVAFMMYLNFLKTNSQQWLEHAEKNLV